MLSRDSPYPRENGLDVAQKVIDEDYRPTIPSHCPSTLSSLIQRFVWTLNKKLMLHFTGVGIGILKTDLNFQKYQQYYLIIRVLISDIVVLLMKIRLQTTKFIWFRLKRYNQFHLGEMCIDIFYLLGEILSISTLSNKEWSNSKIFSKVVASVMCSTKFML